MDLEEDNMGSFMLLESTLLKRETNKQKIILQILYNIQNTVIHSQSTLLETPVHFPLFMQ